MSTIKTFQKIKAAVAKAPAIRDSPRLTPASRRSSAPDEPQHQALVLGRDGPALDDRRALETTAVALEGILEDLRARGLLCVTVSELLVR